MDVSEIEQQIYEAVQLLSLPASGLWLKMRYLIDRLSDRPGHLQIDGRLLCGSKLALKAGSDSQTVSLLLAELASVGLINLSKKEQHIWSPKLVAITGRRARVREKVAKSRQNSIRARQPSNDKDLREVTNGTCNRDVTAAPSPALSPPPPLSSFPPTTPLTPIPAPTPIPPPPVPAAPDYAEPPQAADSAPEVSPTVMTFPVSGRNGGEWVLTEALVAEYVKDFPAVDVLAECRKARRWCIDNPAKRKTRAGIQRFVSGWLTRCQDRPNGESPRNLYGNRNAKSAPSARGEYEQPARGG